MGEYLNVSSNILMPISWEHGDSSFVPWTNAYVGCKPLLDVLDEQGKDLSQLHDIYTQVQQAGYEIVKRKKSTYMASGFLNRLVQAIFNDENVIFDCIGLSKWRVWTTWLIYRCTNNYQSSWRT